MRNAGRDIWRVVLHGDERRIRRTFQSSNRRDLRGGILCGSNRDSHKIPPLAAKESEESYHESVRSARVDEEAGVWCVVFFAISGSLPIHFLLRGASRSGVVRVITRLAHWLRHTTDADERERPKVRTSQEETGAFVRKPFSGRSACVAMHGSVPGEGGGRALED
jgi:hypothetical protein